MIRILGGLFLLCLMISALMISGCDSPNTPNVPRQPYHVAATYPLAASANHATAQGDLAAVADGVYGAVVLNVHDLSHIQEIARDTMGSPFAGSWEVALDTINHLLVSTTQPFDSVNPRVFDYVTGEHMMIPETYREIFYAFAISAQRNNLWLWDARRSYLSQIGICRDSDTSAWNYCDGGFAQMYIPTPSFGAAYRGQAVVLRASDGVLAVAFQGGGVHFLNDSTGSEYSTGLVPGSAWGTAWYQDSLLVVAADFDMVIMNVRDPAHPYVISQLQISSSNHMIGVAVDGPYALILDGYDGVYVVDISDTRNPVYVQSFPLSAPSSITADNGRVYATDQVAGLVVYSR